MDQVRKNVQAWYWYIQKIWWKILVFMKLYFLFIQNNENRSSESSTIGHLSFIVSLLDLVHYFTEVSYVMWKILAFVDFSNLPFEKIPWKKTMYSTCIENRWGEFWESEWCCRKSTEQKPKDQSWEILSFSV